MTLNPSKRKYFNRYEIKYQIPLRKRDNIIKHISPFMELDPYITNNHDYEVRSLYYESHQRNSFFEKVDGIKKRVKLRIRYYPDFYNTENKMVFIELKKKNNENVTKSRVMVPLDMSFLIIEDNTPEAENFYDNATNQERKTLNEIWYFKKKYALYPISVVSYKRQAFQSLIEKTFRITFDSNIVVRNHNFDLTIGGGTNYIVPRNIIVMEIKFNSLIPNWAIKILQASDCIQEKISKFAEGLKKISVYSVY